MQRLVSVLFLLILSPFLWGAGNIEVHTVPAGARVYLEYLDDGGIKSVKGQDTLKTQDPRFTNGLAYAGTSPLRIDMIGVGKFKVVAELEGYEKSKKEAIVYDEKTTSVTLELKRKLHSPEIGEDILDSDQTSQFTVEISMKTEAGPVPILTNLSEIIYQDANQQKIVIDKNAIIENKTPPSFSGGVMDTKYYIRNLSDDWYVIAQMDEESIFTIELKVYDAAKNVIYSDMTTGSYEILSIYNWEINQ